MQSRRDQIQAHSFVIGRLTSGVLRIDPDGVDQPVSRTSSGTMVGFVLAVIAGVVVALYGVIVPGGSDTSWQKPGTLVIDSATGARFLFAGAALHPVLNMASARLVAGDQMTIDRVNTSSLAGAPRGAPIGIMGAPDELPPSTAMSTAAWSACASPQPETDQRTGRDLVVATGQPLPVERLTANQGIMVRDPSGTDYLLWSGRRFRTTVESAAALGYGGAAVAVPAEFLDAVPAGPDLAPPPIAGLGQSGPALAGAATRIGQLFADNTQRHYILTLAGLVPLTPTLFALYDGDPAIQQHAYAGTAITVGLAGPDDLARHPAPAGSLPGQTAELPTEPPSAAHIDAGEAVCVVLQPSGQTLSTELGVADAGTVDAHAVPPVVAPGVVPSCRPANLISFTPGDGMLVAASLAGGGPGSTTYLVTDGVKYPLPSPGVVGTLGYTGAAEVTLPSTLVGLLPTGPSLDPAELAQGSIVMPPAGPSCL